jgi:hypothetical protein
MYLWEWYLHMRCLVSTCISVFVLWHDCQCSPIIMIISPSNISIMHGDKSILQGIHDSIHQSVMIRQSIILWYLFCSRWWRPGARCCLLLRDVDCWWSPLPCCSWGPFTGRLGCSIVMVYKSNEKYCLSIPESNSHQDFVQQFRRLAPLQCASFNSLNTSIVHSSPPYTKHSKYCAWYNNLVDCYHNFAITPFDYSFEILPFSLATHNWFGQARSLGACAPRELLFAPSGIFIHSVWEDELL